MAYASACRRRLQSRCRFTRALCRGRPLLPSPDSVLPVRCLHHACSTEHWHGAPLALVSSVESRGVAVQPLRARSPRRHRTAEEIEPGPAFHLVNRGGESPNGPASNRPVIVGFFSGGPASRRSARKCDGLVARPARDAPPSVRSRPRAPPCAWNCGTERSTHDRRIRGQLRCSSRVRQRGICPPAWKPARAAGPKECGAQAQLKYRTF